MSDEKKSDVNETPEFSPDSASAALRAAFLELSKSAWDIEKEIKVSSSEIFDAADEEKKTSAIVSGDEEKKSDENILEDIITQEKPKKKRGRKPKNSSASVKKAAETPAVDSEPIVSEPSDLIISDSPSIDSAPVEENLDAVDNAASEIYRETETVKYEESIEEPVPETPAPVPEENVAVKIKKERKNVFGFFKDVQQKVKTVIEKKSTEKSTEKESEKIVPESSEKAPVVEAENYQEQVQNVEVEESVEMPMEKSTDESVAESSIEQSENYVAETYDQNQEEEVESAPVDVPAVKAESKKDVPQKKLGPSYWQRMFAPEDRSQKSTTGLWRTIMGRELKSYFTSPIAYIVTVCFLLLSGFLFFPTFFLEDRAELRYFFQNLPVLFSLFIPAMTMRLFSEEKKSGSLETLMTLPVTSLDVVLGKYFAALISSLFMLLPTLSYLIACNIFGHPDAGPIWGGYIGAIFLAAAFSAIGLFSSSITNNQILSLFVALAICIFLTFVSSFVVLLPPFLANMLTFISASSHFDSIARGILDSRDLIYFVSVTVLFVALTVRRLNCARKGK